MKMKMSEVLIVAAAAVIIGTLFPIGLLGDE